MNAQVASTVVRRAQCVVAVRAARSRNGRRLRAETLNLPAHLEGLQHRLAKIPTTTVSKLGIIRQETSLSFNYFKTVYLQKIQYKNDKNAVYVNTIAMLSVSRFWPFIQDIERLLISYYSNLRNF